MVGGRLRNAVKFLNYCWQQRDMVCALQVCMSTDNLFQRCRQRSKVAHGNVTNPLLQLEAIGNFVSDLGAIKELGQKNVVKSSAQSLARVDKLSIAGDK